MMCSSGMILPLVLLAGVCMLAKGQGFGDRPGCSGAPTGQNGLYAKHCYDVLDEYGECLPDDLEWFEEECSRTIGDPGYDVLAQYQAAIDECFADPSCDEVPYSW